MKRLTLAEKIVGAVLVLLLILAGFAWWKTAPPTPHARKSQVAAITATDLVDQNTYSTAQSLLQLAPSPEEQALSQSALRIADHELDLAFTEAMRDAVAHPPALNSGTAAIQARVTKSRASLAADQQHVNEFTAALAQAKGDQKDRIQDQLDLAQSQSELDKDELEEANQDLVDAGGNPRQQIETMVQQHELQSKAHATPAAAKVAARDDQHAAIGKFRNWRLVRQKERVLEEAQASALLMAQALGAHRATLANELKTNKGAMPDPAGHTDAASLVGHTQAIAADQAILTLLNKRIADQNQLASIYSQWAFLIGLQSQALAHGMLLDALVVICILIASLLLDSWAQRLLDSPKLDRRQVETLRSIARVSLRIVALLIIVLIIMGMPSQFATTIGIVGAGLTVALKDFIVAFFGWLVLMGRNGIRLGDWVEINGVSGEVTELGMFHTVLLETGNWSDSGHPTGRRVTFTNSFAIEGHYFNFSTSGQWLWDELQLIVPIGRDPYPIVDAITKQVAEATAESARQAEQEWQRAVPAQRGKVFSGTPGVNVKPVFGGVEIAVRYITRANERFLVRAKLYQAAVDLLGAAPSVPSAPSD